MAFVSKKDKGVGKSLIKGFFTGGAEALICYPTEFIKTQLQLQSTKNPEFNGILDCAKKIVRRNGFTGLYSGMLPLFFGSGAKQASRWAAYNKVSYYFRDDNDKIGLFANMFCGFCAGTTEALSVVTIVETLKTRVTDDIRKQTNRYSGSLDALVKIVNKEGPLGLYRGAVPTVLKQGTNQMIRIPLQLFYMNILTGGDPQKRMNPIYNGLCGALAGATSVFLTMPQDTIKSRMQGEEGKKMYKSTLDCAKKILRNEGPRFFYAGTIPRLMRVTLDVGITFSVYPLITLMLQRAGVEKSI